MATLKDIALKAGVSISTVSHVVNKTRPVSEQLEDKIKKAMKELNCLDEFPTRKKKSSQLLAIIVDDFKNPFFIEVFIAAEKTARTMGYNLIVLQSIKKEQDLLYLEDLQNESVIGYIIATRLSIPFIRKIISSKQPVVFLGSNTDLPFSSGVVLPDEEGGFIATQHLIDLGHTNIISMGGPSEISLFRNRYKGYERALSKNKITPQKNMMIEITPNFQESFDVTADLLKSKRNKVTAIMTHNDISACGVMAAAHGLGISIPDEISVVGFDNTYLTHLTNPFLTSVNLPKELVGQRLIEIMVRLLQGKHTEPNFIEEVNLSIKNSTSIKQP